MSTQSKQTNKQKQEQFSDYNVFQNLDFNSQQMQTLFHTVCATINIKINRLKNKL